MENLAYLGMACALCFSALGSGFGTGVAGQSAVGGWKKCYAAGKPAPFILLLLLAHRLRRQSMAFC